MVTSAADADGRQLKHVLRKGNTASDGGFHREVQQV